MNWDHIHNERRDGFEIDVFVAPEEVDPADLFDYGHEETIAAIHEGQMQWFMVKVTAGRLGLIMGADYLGGCCYASAREFLACDYYDDMVAEAIQGARETLARLREEAA